MNQTNELSKNIILLYIKRQVLINKTSKLNFSVTSLRNSVFKNENITNSLIQESLLSLESEKLLINNHVVLNNKVLMQFRIKDVR